MALGSLSSAKINKKILFFQGKALFYLFIISNIFVHHITIHGMNAFFREMDAYLAVTWVYSPDRCTIGVFIIIGGAFIIKVGGFFLCPMPPMDNQPGIFFQFALMIFGASI